MKFSSASLWLAVLPLASLADSLGSVGPLYPITEQSALTMIENALKAKQQSGELARLEKEAIKRSMNSVRNLAPVQGIVLVRERTSRLIDPTVSYSVPVTTEEGQIVVPAGARINPLDLMKFSKTLVFFDGRDPAQVQAVHRMVQKNSLTKPILIAGSWMDIGKAWGQQVFFDQRGTLSHRFGVQAVPTVIRQSGRALLLEEIPTKDLK